MRHGVLTILAGTTLVLCGCTSSPPTTGQTPPPPPEVATSGATTPAPAASEPDPVLAYQPSHETVLGFLEQQEGTNEIGPLSTGAPAVAVYAVCRGAGTVEVQVLGLGEFAARCQADPGTGDTKNVFDTRAVDEFSVEVQGGTGQQWAISIAETTQEAPG